MKTIGLLGGMSWESTLTYYHDLNVGIKEELGGLHSAKITMKSVDFGIIEKLQHRGDWDKLGNILAKEAKDIESAGADFLVVCTNTMHKLTPQIENKISIPLLHIADATGLELQKKGITTVGLLGTAFTMEQEFYKTRIEEKFNIKVITPNKKDRKIVHTIIYEELCLGKIKEDSKNEYLRIIDTLLKDGVQGVILGCTEIGLLINQKDTEVQLFDTTKIHVQAAIKEALKK
jgi:aspartate racemase